MPRVHNVQKSISRLTFNVPQYVFDEIVPVGRAAAGEDFPTLLGSVAANFGAKVVLQSWYEQPMSSVWVTGDSEIVRNLPPNSPVASLDVKLPRDVWDKLHSLSKVLDASTNMVARYVLTKWADKRIAKRS